MKMKLFGLTETKLFHFHRMFKSDGRGGGSSESPELPLPPRSATVTATPSGTRSLILIGTFIFFHTLHTRAAIGLARLTRANARVV